MSSAAESVGAGKAKGRTGRSAGEQGRKKLSRERVLEAAVELADRIGMGGFTIRKLATELDSKPMTIYHHVPNKEAIIDGMVDAVFAEIELPPRSLPWQEAIAIRSRSARAVLSLHPWAAAYMESRTNPGPATLRHHNEVLGCFRNAGFSVAMTAHAYAMIDSYIYGFALQEAGLPATGGQEMTELVNEMMEATGAEYPYLTELTVEHILQPGYDFTKEFEFGLELILNGLAAAVTVEPMAESGGLP